MERQATEVLPAALDALGLDAQSQPAPVERYVWGVTAGILRNFYRFLAA
jgi:hypothetical protein